jgi:hypothetical protein
VFADADADAAVAGVRLVGVSFWLFLAGAAVVGAATVYELWTVTPLPDAVRRAAGLAGVVAVLAGSVLRVVGYARCRRVGYVIEAEWPLTCGIVGAVVTAAGLTAVLIARYVADPLHPAAGPLGRYGPVVLAAGVVAELVVLVFFRTLLADTRGPADAGRMLPYLLTLAGTAAAVPVAWFTVVPIATIVGLIRSALLGTPAWLPFAPEELFAWFAVGTGLLILVYQLVRQYTRLLAHSRAGLAEARTPEPVGRSHNV